MDSNNPDYSGYTIDELQDALGHVNGDKYPDIKTAIETEVCARIESGSDVNLFMPDGGFFKGHIPNDIMLTLTGKFFGWSMLIAIPFIFVGSIVFVMIMSFLGVDERTTGIIANLLIIPLNLIGTFFVLRKVLGSRHKNFEVRLVRSEEYNQCQQLKA